MRMSTRRNIARVATLFVVASFMATSASLLADDASLSSGSAAETAPQSTPVQHPANVDTPGVRWSTAPAPHPESGLAVGGAVIAGQPVTFEIADTPEAMQRGLMFREAMPEHHGMLFVWPSEGPRTMWMRNTPLPLSVAFIDAEGHVLNVEDMQPRTLDLHSSRGAARYALEMHQSWFAQHSIQAGERIDFLAR